MKPYGILLPILLSLCLIIVSCKSGNRHGQEELYAELDTEIARSRHYEQDKELRLIQLRRDYDLTTDQDRRTDIINNIISEFNAYNADSALYYINYNLQRPAATARPHAKTRLLIKRADVFAHAGLFSDAQSIMDNIPRDSITPELKEEYYSAYCALYQYLSEYTSEHETVGEYEKKRALYADSLQMSTRPETFNHLVYVMQEMARQGKVDSAITVLNRHLKEYPSGTREYSILASILAYLHNISGNPENFRKYLTLSAISDVKGAIKENMSFRGLATEMFEEGDIERANRYLKKSFADANFYSAGMRNAQSGKMLPVIDEAYTISRNRIYGRLQTAFWIVGFLTVVLLISLGFLWRQFKKNHRANKAVKQANRELSLMSEELKRSNDGLHEKNRELKEYNRTNEQYAGLFMEYCSSAISTLQHYQQSLRVLTAMGGNREVLQKKLESSEVADQLLKNFYLKFDEAILNIYPDFVSKFNALLTPECQVSVKSGELLNTELRVFALIRIGIDDTNKISQFLRCSISTVYTYRSKMRKRALDPDNFENEVKQII